MNRKQFSECPIVVTAFKGNPVNTYFCRFPEWSSCSWANFYLDEAMGTFIVSSDWGDYQHRWGRSGNKSYGTFEEFIASCDSSYITTKFSYDNREAFREFKPCETADDLKNTIIEMRRREEIDEAQARIFFNHCTYLCGMDNDRDFYDGLYAEIDYVEIASHHAYKYDDVNDLEGKKFCEHLGIEPYGGYMRYGYTGQINFLQNELLPSFLKWLAEYLKEYKK